MMEDIKQELEKITRRLDSLEKRFDIADSDRNILEDVVGRLTSLEEQQKLTRQHDNEVRKDIKEEIQLANDRVVAKVETKIEEGVQAFTKRGKKAKTFLIKCLSLSFSFSLQSFRSCARSISSAVQKQASWFLYIFQIS